MTMVIWPCSPEATILIPLGDDGIWSICVLHKGQPEWEPSHTSMQGVWKMCLQLWSCLTLSSSSKGAKQIMHSVWWWELASFCCTDDDSADLWYWNVMEWESKLMPGENLLLSKGMCVVDDVLGRVCMTLRLL